MTTVPALHLRDLSFCRSQAKLSEEYIWHIAYQIINALLYCHLGQRYVNGRLVAGGQSDSWNPVIHRDIKPANGIAPVRSIAVALADLGSVFLVGRSETDLSTVKLGDFGLGQSLQDSTPPSTYVGTHQYMPPVYRCCSPRHLVSTKLIPNRRSIDYVVPK